MKGPPGGLLFEEVRSQTYILLSRHFPPELALIVDGYLPRRKGARTSCWEYDESYIDTSWTGTAVAQAALEGDAHQVELFLKRGADPDMALTHATLGGHCNIVDFVLPFAGRRGGNAIERAVAYATSCGHTHIVNRLLATSLDKSR